METQIRSPAQETPLKEPATGELSERTNGFFLPLIFMGRDNKYIYI